MVHDLTIVTGGATSGKSAFAEGLVVARALPKTYIATAHAWDEEMRRKIAAHRASRSGWATVEAPTDLCGALRGVDAGSAVLIDCATMWLSNLLLADADLEGETEALLGTLRSCPVPVVVVTNEVGWSIVPDNALARRFRDAQGRLNQRLAANAGRVFAVISGLPLRLK